MSRNVVASEYKREQTNEPTHTNRDRCCVRVTNLSSYSILFFRCDNSNTNSTLGLALSLLEFRNFKTMAKRFTKFIVALGFICGHPPFMFTFISLHCSLRHLLQLFYEKTLSSNVARKSSTKCLFLLS